MSFQNADVNYFGGYLPGIMEADWLKLQIEP